MWIMVLNDGETYSALEGCKAVKIPDECMTGEVDIETFLRGESDFEIQDEITFEVNKFTITG